MVWLGPSSHDGNGGIPVPATAIYQPTRQKHVPRKSEAAPVGAMRMPMHGLGQGRPGAGDLTQNAAPLMERSRPLGAPN
jgi:hypothetical protein